MRAEIRLESSFATCNIFVLLWRNRSPHFVEGEGFGGLERLWKEPGGSASDRPWRSSGVERGSGQRREEREGVLNFLSGCCFSWPALHTAKGSVLSWAWAQAEGRAGEGPLPFRRGGGATVISETGRPEALGCLPHLAFLLAKVLVPLVDSSPHGPSAKAPEVPPAWPTLSLFDSEQVICALSLLFPCQQNGGRIGVKMGESVT